MNNICKGCILWKLHEANCWFWYEDKQDCLSAVYRTSGGLDKKVKNVVKSGI